MQISDKETSRALGAAPTLRTQAVASGYAATPDRQSVDEGPAAAVEISDQARSLSAARAAVDAAPDVRDDIVTRIKAQVDAGTYTVSSKDIAEQMIRRAQADSIR